MRASGHAYEAPRAQILSWELAPGAPLGGSRPPGAWASPARRAAGCPAHLRHALDSIVARLDTRDHKEYPA